LALVVVCSTLLAGVVSRPAAGDDAASEARPGPEAIAFFEKNVRPILAENCWKCHGAEKQKGGLRLDSLESILAGGESGPAIAPGNPEGSLLVSAINYDSLEMPPTGKLPPAAIEALTTWVRMGAPWPKSGGEAAVTIRPRGLEITDQDRQHWAYQPVRAEPPPSLGHPWVRTPIDAFVLEKLLANGLEPAPPADKRTLVRRAYLDLWGLPPSWEDVEAFVNDTRPDAFAHLVDRLLEHPNYARHWARYWLDLVRYAESDGYKQDAYRPNAYRYRDYVIDAFHVDKPYDRFIVEQLAGDELAPEDPQVLAATGFLRHTIYEYNQRDVRSQWDFMITEVTDVTAEVFLAVSLGCARCHDHKFDPIPQRDYYRFRAYFEAMILRDDVPAVDSAELAAYWRQKNAYQDKLRPIEEQIAAIEAPFRQQVMNAAIDKFPKDVRVMLRKAPAERSPYEEQIARLAGRQLDLEQQNLKVENKLQGEDKQRYLDLCRQRAALDPEKPTELPVLMSVSDVGPEAPPTYVGGYGKGEPVEPGTLSVLPIESPTVVPVSERSTGRRLALARWIARPDNPLTARVMVNRLWQYHFGRGLVATSSDFGRLGEHPTHPELLDWLAQEFVARGWRLKEMHRLIMNSAVYQQASRHPDEVRARTIDPQNRLLWKFSVRRLSAEEMRDSMLFVSGSLRERAGGPAAELGEPVRSVYLKVLRNTRDPLLETFDGADGFNSVAQRYTTVTATQALLLMNSPMVLDQARALAASAANNVPADERARLSWLYRRLYGRTPLEEEVRAALRFLEEQTERYSAANSAADTSQQQATDEPRQRAWTDLCHVLLNSSEFLYLE